MKILIAIPCMDMINTSFARSLLSLRMEGEVQITFSQGSLIYDSRNQLANIALAGGFDRILWLDSDMVFRGDLLEHLSADLDEGRDFVAALYFGRKPPIRPALYGRLGMYPRPVDGATVPVADPIADWPEEELFEVEGAGFGAVLMTAQLLRDVRDRYGLPFSPILGFGEDFSFCIRARELGAKLWCDPRLLVEHEGFHRFGLEEYKLSKGG